MTHPRPETPLTSQAAERIRTADPFITREIEVPPSTPNPHEKGGSGRLGVTRTAGKDTPLDSKPTLRARFVLTVARALNVEAGRQMGLVVEDDWETITDREREGWRTCAAAAQAALDGAGVVLVDRTDLGRAIDAAEGHWDDAHMAEALRPIRAALDPEQGNVA